MTVGGSVGVRMATAAAFKSCKLIQYQLLARKVCMRVLSKTVTPLKPGPDYVSMGWNFTDTGGSLTQFNVASNEPL